MTPEQTQALARARELDARERAVRADLAEVRAQLRDAVAVAVVDAGLPLAAVARELGRDRPALYRWLERPDGRGAG